MKKMNIKKCLLCFLLLTGSFISNVIAVNVIPVRTDINGFDDWIDSGISGTAYLQLLINEASTITPAINLENYTEEKINFKARTYGGINEIENTITVSISNDDGNSWAIIGTRTPLNATLTSVSSIDLSAYSGSQIRLKFSVAGTSNVIGAGIDDISITGTPVSGSSNDSPSVLSKGDIAILQVNSSTIDQIAFVTFVDLNPNTIINFTDNGYAGLTAVRTGEGFLTYTAPGFIASGTVISWYNGMDITGTGWNTATPSGFALTSGDQLFVYQGIWNSDESVICGVSLSPWIENGESLSTTSYKPLELENQVNTFSFPSNVANAIYSNITSGSNQIIKSLIFNSANWSTSSSDQGAQSWLFNFGTLTEITHSSTALNLSVSNNETLTINENGKLTIEGSLTNDGTFIIKSGATLLTEGNITGNANVQLYLTAKSGETNDHWWYIAPPVTGATSGSILTAGSNNKFGSYNEVTGLYPQITATDVELTAGKGYLAQINTTGTYEFSGALNTGNVGPITLTRTPAVGAPRGFNLVGNPYPSFIDWNAVTGFGTLSARTDIRPTVWIRTRTASGEMDFDTWDGEDGVSKSVRGLVSRYIAPMQAFWVKVNADNTTPAITFTNAMRSHQDQSQATNKLRAPAVSNRQILRLNISNGINFDETVISTNESATDQYDFFDSDKMPVNNPLIPELYSLVDNRELVINKMNKLDAGKSVMMGFRPGSSANFSITANEMQNLDNVEVVLKDITGNAETILSEGQTYEFSADENVTSNRFVVLFNSKDATTATVDMLSGSLHAYVNTSGQITVLAPGYSLQSKVYVQSLTGQTIAKLTMTDQKATLNKQLNPGIYLINISDGSKLETCRVIVK